DRANDDENDIYRKAVALPVIRMSRWQNTAECAGCGDCNCYMLDAQTMYRSVHGSDPFSVMSTLFGSLASEHLHSAVTVKFTIMLATSRFTVYVWDTSVTSPLSLSFLSIDHSIKPRQCSGSFSLTGCGEDSPNVELS
ncbi:MAG: hypothetical protein WD768_15565, partial [Phycisphaeraceae bacterium]